MTEPLHTDVLPTPRSRVPRRRYLIDPKRQLRATAMTTSVVAVLVIIVNAGFALLRDSQASFLAAVAPQLETVIAQQNATLSLIVILCSVTLVVAVSLKTIVETHRTAGAVFAVRQRLDRLRRGDLDINLRLRRNDNLHDLEEPFNEMVASLRDRALSDASALERLADRASEIGPVGREIAEEIRDLAREKRQIGT
jgi:methyl-accepting chemotaxis protein